MESKQRDWPVRRRFRRFGMRTKPATVVANTFARVIDVSVNGLAVETPSQLTMGKAYTFDLSHGDVLLVVDGTIRWSKLRGTRKTVSGGSEKIFQAGVMFDRLETETELKLVDFIERYANVSTVEKLFGRLKWTDAQLPPGESSIGVKVKRIGRRKVLVESELYLDPGAGCELELKLMGNDFRARARVVFLEQRKGVKPEATHRIGLEFSAVAPEHQEVLERFIASELAKLDPVRLAQAGVEGGEAAADSQLQAPPGEATTEVVNAVKGNVKSKIAHVRRCRSYDGRDCTAAFNSIEEAIAAGFRPCRLCQPDG